MSCQVVEVVEVVDVISVGQIELFRFDDKGIIVWTEHCLADMMGVAACSFMF